MTHLCADGVLRIVAAHLGELLPASTRQYDSPQYSTVSPRRLYLNRRVILPALAIQYAVAASFALLCFAFAERNATVCETAKGVGIARIDSGKRPMGSAVALYALRQAALLIGALDVGEHRSLVGVVLEYSRQQRAVVTMAPPALRRSARGARDYRPRVHWLIVLSVGFSTAMPACCR